MQNLRCAKKENESARRSIFLGGSDDTGLILSESITLDSITNANELVSVIQHLPENTTLVKVFGDGGL